MSFEKLRAHAIDVDVHVGKAGLTKEVVEEIKRRLKKQRLVKIKFLSSFAGRAGRKALVAELAESAGARIVHAVGFVVTLGRKKMQAQAQ